ncbi:phage portal protein, HK97 family [Terribacillus aidingensis]|uniref:Phage portal protein, HK97 family n=2 Tax=Terribacillus aidingensis TaxID=586416 RepID=A0A285P3X1_9BACI|nr:phage portal protein, HK97 family [Terribacillus aidingensis]
MGVLDLFGLLKRNRETEVMLDLDLFEDAASKTHLKRMAIETCIGLISRTISQSEFRVRKDKKTIKDEMYYKLNLRPNKNMSASYFWQKVVRKLIYDNDCLIIQSDTGDLLIADSFIKNEYAVMEDVFKNVIVKDYEFKRNFLMSEVIYIQYSNEKLSKLIDELFYDYGELFGRLVEFQKRKNQIRATVDIESVAGNDEEKRNKIQKFIDRTYAAIRDKVVAIIPQQKGFTYREHQKDNAVGPSVEEINKVTEGFMSQVAAALGIPIVLLKGDTKDLEKPTRNYMVFCIKPLVKKISDALNYTMVDRSDYLNGQHLEIRTPTYSEIFDLANSIDKLIASGGWNRNELRDKVGDEMVDDPKMDEYVMTKNYESIDKTGTEHEGGDTEDE